MMDDIASRLRIVSVFIFLGFLMTLGMTAMTLLNPGGGSLYEVRVIGNVIADLLAASAADINITLVSLVFDNFFIIGYLCIFYGLFLITKERDRVIATVGFALGITTGFTDLIENAFQVALLTGVPNGWVPADSVFSSLWIVMYVKDISSYMAGFVFIVMLLLTLRDRQEIQLSKMVFVILLGLYVSLGIISIVEPSFLVFRNLSFMIDMLIGSLLFRQMSAKLG